eukprot:g12929.t1
MNKLRDEMRRRGRQARPMDMSPGATASSNENASGWAAAESGVIAGGPSMPDAPLDQLDRAEQVGLLKLAIAKLPEADQEVLHLRHTAGLSFAQIAETLDQPLGTVLAPLSEQTPAELEAKILELTDPQMLSLLDEALMPEQPSDALTQRILAATTGQPADTDASPGMLARIGPTSLRYAAAAAIVLAVGLGVYFINQEQEASDNSIADNTDPIDLMDDEAPLEDADWLAQEQFVYEADYFSRETDPISDALDSASDSLDDAAITRDTLWAEFDAFEAFLDEFDVLAQSADGPRDRPDGERPQQRERGERPGDRAERSGDRDRNRLGDRDGDRDSDRSSRRGSLSVDQIDEAIATLRAMHGDNTPSWLSRIEEQAKEDPEEAAKRLSRFPRIRDMMESRKNRPEEFALQTKQSQIMRELFPIVGDLRKAQSEGDQAKIDELKPQVRERIEQLFQVRLELKSFEIERIREKLAKAQQELIDIQTDREALIEEKLAEILSGKRQRDRREGDDRPERPERPDRDRPQPERE